MPTLPFEERKPDDQYQRLLGRILDEGEWGVARKRLPRVLTLMQQTMRFDMRNGFPMIADRDMSKFWRKPIAEICAFINGATTTAELEEFGCGWWGPWATEKKTAKLGLNVGDMGPGSYGGAFFRFPSEQLHPNGGFDMVGFDQFEHLVQQIRELPHLRTHFVSPWIPLWQARGGGRKPLATIAPCHGWVHVRVLNGRLHLHMFQRSGDAPVGVPSNMIQYAALLLMLEQLTGYEAGVYYHTISDAHIYEDQLPAVQELIDREPGRFPTVTLTEAGRSVTDIHDFRAEHFELADYFPQAAMRIPVAV